MSAEAQAGRALWREICDPGASPLSADPAALGTVAARLAWRTSPALVAWATAGRFPGLIDADDVTRATLYARYLRGRARDGLALLGAAGVPVLALKGFASGARFYPDPALRGMGDVDLLVRPADAGRACDVLEGEGFRFRRSARTPRWGLATESSFHPLVAADGAFTFDLHVAADDYPVGRALAVDHVFADAQTIDVDGQPVRVPSDDHLLLLAATNAARDKFGPDAARSVIDLAVALGRPLPGARPPDWPALISLARQGGFIGALRVAVRLLARLGVPAERLPSRLLGPYGWVKAGLFEGVVADFLAGFAAPPTRFALQARDWMLISSGPVLAYRNWRRLRGLIRPWPGVPVGRRVEPPGDGI